MELVTDVSTMRPLDITAETPKTRPDNGILRRVMVTLVNLAGGAWSSSQGVAKKRMRVVETLALGAKKQLVLVSCDGEHFLVGTGSEQVHTIVRLGRVAAESEVAIVTDAGVR